MKKNIVLFSLLLSVPLMGEFHAGVGFSWNTVDETFESTLRTNEDRRGHFIHQSRYQVFLSGIHTFHEYSILKI